MNRNATDALPKTFPIFARFDGHIMVDTERFQEDPEGEIARAIQNKMVDIDTKHGYVPATEHYDKDGNVIDVRDEIDF